MLPRMAGHISAPSIGMMEGEVASDTGPEFPFGEQQAAADRLGVHQEGMPLSRRLSEPPSTLSPVLGDGRSSVSEVGTGSGRVQQRRSAALEELATAFSDKTGKQRADSSVSSASKTSEAEVAPGSVDQIKPTFRSRPQADSQHKLNPQVSLQPVPAKSSNKVGRSPLRPWQSLDEASFAARQRPLEALDARQRKPSFNPTFSKGLLSESSALEEGRAPDRELGGVWQGGQGLQESASSAGSEALTSSFGSQAALTGQLSRQSGEGSEARAHSGRVSRWGTWKLPQGLAMWQRLTGHKLKLSTLKTALFAAWAFGIMGVLPFVNTVSNAWFIAILYSPRVLDCIDFVEQSPGADPSEFPIISGALLQALSWLCVILGAFDIGDLLTRLGLHLYKQGVPIRRFRLFLWTAIKWLMIEDERSTHIGGYTHARLREFLFSSGADSIEIFVTASFLFWTGSGYPLATLSLFTSLLSIYLAWSFEISWHLWYLGRRFSPFWPHPTVRDGSHDNSRTLLLGNEASGKRGWFKKRQKAADSSRSSTEGNLQDRDQQEASQNRGTAGGGGLEDNESRKSRSEAADADRERRASFDAIDVDALESETVDYVVRSEHVAEQVKGPSNEQSDSCSVLMEGRAHMQSKDIETGNVFSEQEALKASQEQNIGSRYPSELQSTWDAFGQGEIRHRRSRSLDTVDVQVGIIRTLSQASERNLVSANPIYFVGAQRSRLCNLQDNSVFEETEAIRTASGDSFQGGADPPRKDEVGRGERYLFRAIRGVVLLGMVLAVLIALWLADFGPGVLYGVGITYLTRISTQVHVRCEPFAAPGTFVDYVLPFNGSSVLNLDGVFFYYTAASNAYIFDTSDDELSSITEHDFVVGAVADRFITYGPSRNESTSNTGSIKIRFATVLRGVALLVTSSDAWARQLAGQGNTTSAIVLKKKLPPLPPAYVPINQRLVYKYNTKLWQTQSVPVHKFSVPVFCRSPYSNATSSPLGRLIALNASISMAGVSCYDPGNATFKLPPKEKQHQSKTSTFY